MRKFLLLALTSGVVWGLVGCSRGRINEVVSLEHHVVDSLDLSLVLHPTRIISFRDSVLLGRVKKVMCSQEGIFVWSGDSINLFSAEGEPLARIGRKGRGPGEYTMITDFTVSDGIVVVLDQFKRILTYDSRGKNLRVQDIPFYAASCVIVDDNILLSSAYQDRVDKFHVYSLSELKETASFEKIDENEMTYRHFMTQNNFFIDRAGRLLFHEPMNNKVYRLLTDRLDVAFSFDLWGKTPPESFWSHSYGNVMEIVKALNAEGYVYGTSFFAYDKRAYVMTYSDEGGMKMALHDQNIGTSLQSPRLFFQDLTTSFAIPEVAMTFNSYKEVLFVIPAQCFEDTTLRRSANPVLVVSSF